MLDPMKCIAKVANKMKSNEEYKTSNGHYPSSHKEATEKDPMGLSAAVLYMSYFNNNTKISDVYRRRRDARNQDTGNRSQTSFAQTAGVTDVTLRHTIKDLKNRLHLLN